jgi:Uma2 family endonuclease
MPAPPPIRTLTDLAERVGDIPFDRIRLDPRPGTATEQDLIDIMRRDGVPCELIDGVVVEKAVGFSEGVLAAELAAFLHTFVRPRKLGVVGGADTMMRLRIGLVRYPDVCFVSWATLGGRMPKVAIPNVAPDLAVEVLSASNTLEEMKRKRHHFFTAGTRLMWIVDPVKRTVTVYTDPTRGKLLKESATLTGGTVLRGFSLPLRDLFAVLDGPDA